MTSPQPPERSSRRTSIITAASIGAVGIAGLIAIGANLGILTTANQNTVGTVAAAGDLVPVDTQLVDLTAATTTTGSQHFTVDEAGTVDVSVGTEGIRLELATPASGWSVTKVTAARTDVAVDFTDGTRTLEFNAVVGPDGAVTSDVTEPSDPAATPEPAKAHDDDHHADDDHHSDDDHHYEGAGDDD